MGDVIFPVNRSRALLDMHDVESDLGFHHVPETIPRTFPMTWATKFDPHHLQPLTVIVRSLRPEVEILFRLEMRCIVCSLLPRPKLFVLNQGTPSFELLR